MSSDPALYAPHPQPPSVQWSADADSAVPVDPNFWTPPPPDFNPTEQLAEAKPPRKRLRLLPRSLTGRLVTGVVTLVVILVLATGLGTYFALRSFLYDRLDQQVQSVASGDLKSLFFGRSTSAGVSAPQTVWAVALDTSGSVLAAPEGLGIKGMNLSVGNRHELLTRGPAPMTITTTDGTQLRVSTRPVIATSTLTGQETSAIAVIGLSTDEVQRTLRRLLDLEIAIGASAVVLAMAATAYGVQFSLRRLRRVTGTAQEVAAELSPQGTGLDRRVPLASSDATEVGQLAESMNTLLSAVETQFAARLAQEQQMRQFLADASHELRTPLTSIRGYAELARMQREQGNGIETAENLSRIESEGTRMSRLVEDLLTLARTDQGGEPRNEWIDINELLDEAVSGVRAAYPARQIDLITVAPGLNTIGDHDQLLQVVRNLATNAATHTRPDGAIRVSAAREAGWIAVRVSDAGPGLPPDEAAHVFERFWRADKSRTRSRGGSGLGLAIVASIVAAHGGSVRFDSTVVGGSTVTVYLPPGTD